MRGAGGAVLMAWLVAACSGSAKQAGATGGMAGSETAGAAGSGSSAGASSSSGNGGAAGSPAGGAGGASTGTAGAAGSGAGASAIQGLPGAHHPDCGGDCGGSPVGRWVYNGATSCNVIPTYGGALEPEECTVRLLPNSAPGEPPIRLERAPRFDLSGQPLDLAVLTIDESGSFTMGVIYKGTGHLQLAAQCRKLGENVALCSDVSTVVEQALVGEGIGRNFMCIDNAEGGCDCSYELTLVSGPAGVWRTTPEGKLLLRPSNLLPDAPEPEPATYCVGETLALGPELRIPGQPAAGEPTVFARLDCSDGAQGPGEQGVDCGQLCNPCP